MTLEIVLMASVLALIVVGCACFAALVRELRYLRLPPSRKPTEQPETPAAAPTLLEVPKRLQTQFNNLFSYDGTRAKQETIKDE